MFPEAQRPLRDADNGAVAAQERVVDIEHELTVNAPIERVFTELSTGAGLSSWWTLSSTVEPGIGGRVQLNFGPSYQWAGIIRVWDPPVAIEWEMTETAPMPDWLGTRVGVRLTADGSGTVVHFFHRGWTDATQHARISSFCWAMYLRLMARHCVSGEVIPFAHRNDLQR
jgi:uncharacterized protein YndB with AHSA1/START domain